MGFAFDKLQHKNALIIADDWKYEEPYSFYDMTADLEDYNELVDETLRNAAEYFEATVGGELAGFFSLSRQGDEIEIGLGLKPALCGKGLGREFVNRIIDYVNENEADSMCSTLCVSVACFNTRAIKVYEACGFKKQGTFMQEANGGKVAFVKMTRARQTPASPAQ